MFKGLNSGLRVLVSSLVLANVISCSVGAGPATTAEPGRGITATAQIAQAHEQATVPASDAAEETLPAVATSDTASDAGAAKQVEAPAPRVLRRLQGSEVNGALVQMANKIIHEHHAEPFGTEIPFEIDGQEYVGKIERHYHPEGGELHPWGYHPGCSLFVVESAS